jgi:hypothetical protein
VNEAEQLWAAAQLLDQANGRLQEALGTLGSDLPHSHQ